MSPQKQISTLAEKARTCLADLKSVPTADFDMVRWMNQVAFESKINEVERALDGYNGKLQEADNARKVFEAKQRELEDLANQLAFQLSIEEEPTQVSEVRSAG